MSNYIEQRPWGSFEILLDSEACKVKRITVKAGHKLSLQRHKNRDEHWTIVSGHALITNGEIGGSLHTFRRGPGKTITIPRMVKHRIEAIDDVVFIEVQTGDYFGEDDIERFEDDYGKAGCEGRRPPADSPRSADAGPGCLRYAHSHIHLFPSR